MSNARRPTRVALEDRKRIVRATTLWGALALSGTSLIAVLSIWHLVRRGRVIRASLAPPRPVAPLEARSADLP